MTELGTVQNDATAKEYEEGGQALLNERQGYTPAEQSDAGRPLVKLIYHVERPNLWRCCLSSWRSPFAR